MKKPPPLLPWWFVALIIVFAVAGRLFHHPTGPSTAKERAQQVY